MGTGIKVDNPNVIRVAFNKGVKHKTPITVGQLWGRSMWKTIELTAVMVQMTVILKRVWETWALTQMIMKAQSFLCCPPLLLLCSHPHVKAAWIAYHYEQQEQQCYTCDETGHFSHNCPVCLQALKDKKSLNSNGAQNVGG